MLLSKHKQHLVRFRIPEDLLKAARIESVTDGGTREKMGVHGRERDELSGIFFPYISPITGERNGARVRLDTKAASDEAKYLSETSCRHLFFPPGVKEMLEDRAAPIVFVEAEKSALAVAA